MSVTKGIGAAVLAAVAVAAPAAQAFPGRDGAIVYGWGGHTETEFPPSVTNISALMKTVSGATNATTLRGCTQTTGKPAVGDCTIGYGSPAISPDGTRIAFATGRSLALIDIDGGGFRMLPAHSAADGEPAFSPTGTRLVFSAGANGGQRGLWTSSLHGTHAHRLTARGSAPAWSTRDRIAFVRPDGIYRIGPNGHGLRRLVARSKCTGVAWSPHATKLAFACGGKLYVAGADGRHARRVMGPDLPYRYVQDVTWSPSGTRLLAEIQEDGLIATRLDGSHGQTIASGGPGATYNLGVGGADWQALR